jgi:hypothetical protein
MSVLNLNPREIQSNVIRKLSLRNVRSTRETYGDYYLDGKFQFRVTMPNIHGKNNSISDGMFKVCRDSVHLGSTQFSDLVRCSMRPERYEEIIRALLC